MPVPLLMTLIMPTMIGGLLVIGTKHVATLAVMIAATVTGMIALLMIAEMCALLCPKMNETFLASMVLQVLPSSLMIKPCQ